MCTYTYVFSSCKADARVYLRLSVEGNSRFLVSRLPFETPRVDKCFGRSYNRWLQYCYGCVVIDKKMQR